MKRNIYNINGGTLEIFDFEPKHYALDLFRLQELKNIPQEEQILRKENTRGWFTPKKGVIYECDNYILRTFPSKKLSDHDEWLRIRRSYINGLYRSDPVKVHDGLITLHPNMGMSHNLVQLTEDSYAEYLLENEQFADSFLEDRDLSKLKDLFEIGEDPYMTIDIKEFQKLCYAKVIDECFRGKMADIEKESEVYQKLK